ncbi:MAG TPA: hypothetical protein VM328_12670 [Fimbriimonadaceae bacterium]|nr:hypothetical protein [Fimbriimonadaceae bacterium]HVM35168.1 hypothetical protein [Actinomycetota bacterium]
MRASQALDGEWQVMDRRLKIALLPAAQNVGAAEINSALRADRAADTDVSSTRFSVNIGPDGGNLQSKPIWM